MDNIFRFRPLWENEHIKNRPSEAIEELRNLILDEVLELPQLVEEEDPEPEDVVDGIMLVISKLLRDAMDTDNDILLRLGSQAEWVFDDPYLYFETLVGLWHLGIEPVLGRDPTFGFPQEDILLGLEESSNQGDTEGNGNESDADATVADPENREDQPAAYDGEMTDQFGCLGVTAMLVLGDDWALPEDPDLMVPHLVTQSLTTMVFTAYLMSHSADIPTIRHVKGQMSFRNSLRAFLHCHWQLHRVSCNGKPGQEFGALPDEVKISTDGKRLLTNIGRADWHEPPFWHPFKKVPGSAWNKFLKNVEQPIFSDKTPTSTLVSLRLPTSAIKLVEPFEEYYAELERRFDEAGKDRRVLELPDLIRQYDRLAAATGQPYPRMVLDEQHAHEVFDINQTFRDYVPLMKNHITDLKGGLTMPFLTSLVRAMRLQEEPQAIGDISMLRFGSLEDGNFW